MHDSDSTIRLTDKDILDFKNLYKKQFGIELEWSDAHDKAMKLVTLMKHVYQPISVEQLEALKLKDEEADK